MNERQTMRYSIAYRTPKLAIALSLLLLSASAVAAKEPVDWVDPTISTASPHGPRWILFASACRPFGMVNLSPDTIPHAAGGLRNMGYVYTSDVIHGFSHVHAWQLSGIPVMPTTGPLKGPQGSKVYGSKFSHDSEVICPGYHGVTLDDYGIRAELTSTDRVGLHRYTFPKSDTSRILFDLGATLGPCAMDDALARKASDTELEGYVVNGRTWRRSKPTPIYFVARFDKPFRAFGGWVGKKVLDDVDEVSGKGSGAFVEYATAEGDIIQLKVAISYVSIEQARLNLDTELPHWDFDRVKQESRQVWNEWLSKIEVEGGTDAQRSRFYTDLWHVLLGRRITSDVNGKYCDMTGPKPVVRQIPAGPDGKPKYAHYNSDCFWGAYWNVNQIWAMAYPELMNGWCNFLVDMYKDGGLIPRGPSAHNYTHVMIATHSTPFIVSAYMKGIRNFDVQKAYEGLRKNHFPGGMMDKHRYEHNTVGGGRVGLYIEGGYIPHDKKSHCWPHPDGSSLTLEYAYDDWCLAQMAKALGKEDDYRLFMKRAGNYRNLWDESTQFMRPRNADGSWLKPFDPLATGKGGFTEGNAWHYTWFVPHDVEGLIQLFGGRDAFNKKLNQAFELSAVPDPGLAPFAEGEGRGYVCYANQPCLQMAHLFNYSGVPWLSQKWVREVKERTFGGVTPREGYRHDDDSGQLSGVGVLMAIGLFEVRGGAALNPVYELTSPIFDKVTIHLDKRYYPGDRFVIAAQNNSKQNKYIQSATLDGKLLNRPWFFHRQLVDGGTLTLELGPKPNKQWGSSPKDAPPSMTGKSKD